MGEYLNIPDENMEIVHENYDTIKSYTIKFGEYIYVKDIFNIVDIRWFLVISSEKRFAQIYNQFYIQDLENAFEICLKKYLRKNKLGKILK